MTMLSERDGLKVLRQTVAVRSEVHREAIDITAQVRKTLHGGQIQSGLVVANCLHTTCSVLVADPQLALLADLGRLMDGVVDDAARYKHDDARLSDCERGNASAHLRASLLGPGVVLGIADGKLLLNRSESILLMEFDGPRERRVHIQAVGH